MRSYIEKEYNTEKDMGDQKNKGDLGKLYIVATPIGNLEDITIRAMKTLFEVDVVLAEDTRVSRKLLDYISAHGSLNTENSSLTKPLVLSYHQHSSPEKKLEILKMLMDGKNLALITDAGTPGISDPGSELVEYLLSFHPELKVVPIPGASAVTAILSVSGFDSSQFLFLGFWPKKKGVKIINLLASLRVRPSGGTDSMAVNTVVFYESPYRILKTLKLLEKELPSNVKIVVARELTKIFETLYRGNIRDVLTKMSTEKIKGEIVVAININNNE